MKFGNIADKELSQVNFSLPPDNPANPSLLANSSVSSTQAPGIYMGCAVWTDPNFVGKIYPSGTKTQDYLKLYSKQFNSVELNATFYSIPSVEQVKKWKSSVAKGFKFCPKVPRTISHSNKLEEQMRELDNFLNAVQYLEETLGMTFLQLPPEFQPNRIKELQKLLEYIPPNFPWAVEFRHPAWFSDSILQQEVVDLLKKQHMVAVMSDVAGRRDVLHQTLTTPSTFIRFRGYIQETNNYTRLNAWIERLKQWWEQGLNQVYFILHETEKAFCIDLALYLAKALNQQMGLQVPVPCLVGQQGSLF
jgi:uncharacterized protein YecE (DUF72 family)